MGLASAAILLAGLVIWFAWISPAESESLVSSARESLGSSARDFVVPGEEVEPDRETIVEMVGLQFRPSRLEIPVGTVVTFINRDSVTHNVVQTTPSQLGRDQAGFASPSLEPGQKWSIRFDRPGRYPILCLDGGHYAVGMLGTIVVHPEEEGN